MIGYLEGKLLNKEIDRILLLVNHVGYEVLLPTFVMESLKNRQAGDQVSLYIYYHQTERQPKPVLIGFNLEAEKAFFQQFISVEAIGPLKAVKAMTIPIREIARAIETREARRLTQLKGIGARNAQKIIASLEGKVGKFALIRKDEITEPPIQEDFISQVMDVLTHQLGHKGPEAKRLIAQAMERNTSISTPEALFDEVLRNEVS